MSMKGIILAGGKGTRLYPLTKSISKQLLPVYDKPMIYYPLSTLLLADIKDILIICMPDQLNSYKKVLSSLENSKIKISYEVQENANGLAEAFIIGESFIDNHPTCLMLGDNILFGHELPNIIKNSMQNVIGAKIFAHHVKHPEQYGILEIDQFNNIVSLEEKPISPKSNYAIIGLYIYDNSACQKVKTLKPSKRGELEITDLNNLYLKEKSLEAIMLGRGHAWFDAGNPESLLAASEFVKTIEDRQSIKIACIEEIAYSKGLLEKEVLLNIIDQYKNEYGKYLLDICQEKSYLKKKIE